MRISPRLGAAILAIVFLAFHLPFLPASLEDLDSINFALGVRHFDVGRHQPHPPGYPLFILVAKGARALTGDEARALSLVGILAGALGAFALLALFEAMESRSRPTWWPLIATILAVSSPLYWFTAARPLSDMTGLVAALAVQALILSADGPANRLRQGYGRLRTATASLDEAQRAKSGGPPKLRAKAEGGRYDTGSLIVASFAAALAAGFRSQAAWLTVPVLVFAIVRRPRPSALRDPQGRPEQGRGPAGSGRPELDEGRLERWHAANGAAIAFVVGVLVWAVPLVMLNGGPASYWRALFSQGSEDLTNIQMLWTTPTPRVLVSALYHAFIAPWAQWGVAAGVLVVAAIGAARLFREDRIALAAIATAFIPYLIFDLLFQETFTTRYALPLVAPVAYLATRGAAALGGRAGLAIVLALSMYDAHMAGSDVVAYSRHQAPAFRLLDDMQSAARELPGAPVFAADRRESLDLRRPVEWVGDRMPPLAARLPAPPQHEWLELVKYWNGGGRSPVWFVTDPRRAQVDLIQHGDPASYRWALRSPLLIGGVRPGEMDWYRLDRPEWYVGEGWALTPEAAGVADTDRRGLATGPIDGWIHRSVISEGTMLIGGRNFSGSETRLTVALDARTIDEVPVMPGAFVHVFNIPSASGQLPPAEYGRLSVSASPPTRAAIEQFDASNRRPILGFGSGWQEQEYNPTTGLRWRWLSERSELRVVWRGGPLVLRIEGESPRKYFSRPSRLLVRAGDRVLVDDRLSSDFAETVTIPADVVPRDGIITLETDQVFIPAGRSRRALDRRHLGLRIFRCEIRPLP